LSRSHGDGFVCYLGFQDLKQPGFIRGKRGAHFLRDGAFGRINHQPIVARHFQIDPN
jgi:hypothetical protein